LNPRDIFPEEETIIDEKTSEEIQRCEDEIYHPKIINGGDIVAEPPKKIYVAGVDVSILNERVQYLDASGKLITESLKDYTKKGILKKFRSLDDFLSKWNSAEKKKSIIEELESNGIILENLMEEVKKDLDVFDLICHIAGDMPALTRRERVEQVKKRNYFTKYSEKAQAVINALLDKYADEGIENIEELSILRVDPLNKFGTLYEIMNTFGGKEAYILALKELEQELYRVAA